MIVSTTNEIAGHRIIRCVGLARGIAIRSRSAVGNFFGGLRMIFGGRLSVYAALAETAREEAFDLMRWRATEGGADAIVGMCYNANEIMGRVTEVLAHGAAIFVETA